MMFNEQESPGTTGLEIAVIGMSGRFPGARNINEFWDNLKNGVEAISFFSDEELTAQGVDPQLLKNPDYVKAKGSIADVEHFDAFFFGYTPREASILDPQVRFFIECSWEALEDAGYDPGSYKGLIGIFAGAAENIFWRARILSSPGDKIDQFAKAFLANKDFVSLLVSYKLGLKGPSSMVYTACSTSLVAIHMACQALLNGECDMAMAGGVRIALPNRVGYLYEPGMVNSPDGHCRAFDKSARGVISGNGVGVVILKRLEEAIEDRDHIYAVIKSSAINNDGMRKVGFLAPSIEGQAEAIRTALHMARVEPESITYIEAHGTGTELGDPVEIEGLKSTFDTDGKGFCAIGAVKANVGHLDIAAGVTGFIKTVMALKNKLIPPALHFKDPNPKIDFKNSPFYVNTKLREWKNNKYPLRAGISSFGIGGTNVHVILEEAPVDRLQRVEGVEHTAEGSKYRLILLSARTETALDKASKNLAEFLKLNPGINLSDAAYTLQVGRREFPYRKTLVCSKVEEAIAALGSSHHPKTQTSIVQDDKPFLVFMFSGLGAQYVNMGVELYREEPIFRLEMDRCFEILKDIVDYDIKEILYPGNDLSSEPGKKNHHSSLGIHHFDISQLVVFIFEYALAKTLMKWGIQPQALIGYSFGEYAAACTAGVFSLEDALKVVVIRGQLMSRLPAGTMLSIPLPIEELNPLLPTELSLAVDNGSSCIAAGTPEAIAAFEEKMKNRGILAIPLSASRAPHSHMMEPILAEFERKLRGITCNSPRIPYISNVTGGWITSETVIDSQYWMEHLQRTVRFAEGMRELVKNPNALLVEIGPGSDLTALAARYIGDEYDANRAIQRIINLVRPSTREVPDSYYLLNKIGRLWLGGVRIDWSTFNANAERYRILLPSYPFERQPYWIDTDSSTRGRPAFTGDSQAAKEADIADWFYIPTWEREEFRQEEENSQQERHQWLVFLDSGGIGSLLAHRLIMNGHEVVTVSIGTSFDNPKPGQYTVNPQQPDDLQPLFNAFISPGKKFYRVLHLWSLSGNRRHWSRKIPGEPFEKVQDMGFYSLINIAKAIGKLGVNASFHLIVITDHLHELTGEESIEPSKSTMIGPIKVIPQEYSNINCSSIDIVWPEPGGVQREELLNRLLEEIEGSRKDTGTTTAFRGNYRWIQVQEPISLPEVKKESLPLREEGVYLVTGGLGKIGLVLAEFLARTVKARLILTGRSQFPAGDENKIRKLQELEALGAKIMTFAVDTADMQEMADVIARAEAQFGTIHGVIHCAGIIRGSSFNVIDEIEKIQVEEQFRAKVFGTLVLDKLFHKKKLDFLWLMSSLSTVLGGLRFAAYAAANAFMDAYVYRLKRETGMRCISVDWNGMPPEETIQAFTRILSLRHVRQVVVSKGGNLQDRIDQWVKLEYLRGEELAGEEKKPLLYPRPQLLNAYEPPTNEKQEIIADIWKKIFGFEKIGIQDNFFELGGDSLGLLKMAAEIKREFNIKIPVVQLFSNPTINKLSTYIFHEQYRETIDAAIDGKFVLLNTPDEKYMNVFCFPPGIGTGAAYMNLALQLTEYNIYSFNFIEDDRCVRQYADTIMEIQEKGPYCLFGYSSGGNLALETALELEQRGEQVSDIIIGDSTFRNEVLILTPESFENKNVNFVNWVETEMEQLGLGHLKERVLERARHYAQYYHSRSDRGKVNARVHLITAINRKENPVLTAESESGVIQNMDWKDVGTSYAVYEGFGVHEKMFSPGFVEKNAAIIRKILEAA
ncbi:MAG: SDR family NAD(P)-dependent oxidoreductase [Candidatus Aminicenantes bacterium]|nr:MAG: SDR family NAD(P)-dependent oxidoreductase [Candidatus Aminicenantes bacterium]